MKVINYVDAVKSIMAHDIGTEIKDSMKKAEEFLNMAEPFELEEPKVTKFIHATNEELVCIICGQRTREQPVSWKYCPKCGARIEK